MSTLSTFLQIIVFTFFCNLSLANSSNTTKFYRRILEKEILDTILNPAKYDNRIRPPFYSSNDTSDEPVIVRVNMFIRSISAIDDVNMEYNVQITFREMWIDDRLMFDDQGGNIRYLTLTDSSRLWMPDLFFSNEKEGHYHNILTPNVYIRIFPSGSVLYSVRISLKLSCPMNLKLMPFDHQICTIRMASYGHTVNDIVFLWKEHDPVSVVKNLYLPRFTLEKFSTDYCNSRTTTGEYSCLKFDFLIRRELSYYLVQIYIPCCMLVILSWISFWIDEKVVTARLLFGTLTLLALSFHVAQINSCLPQTSYTKAIDVWCGTTITFVFATIFEFIVVHYLASKERNAKYSGVVLKDIDDAEHNGSSTTKATESRSTADIVVLEKPTADNGENDRRSLSRARTIFNNFISKMPKSKAKRIDVFSRVLFPAVFVLFIICYWLSCNIIDDDL